MAITFGMALVWLVLTRQAFGWGTADPTQRFKTKLTILAKNVRSISSDIRDGELLENLVDIKWNILFLSETWRNAKEEVWRTHDGHTSMGSAWAGGRRGVAIPVHQKQTKGFRDFFPISERACATYVDIYGAKL